MPSAVPDSDCRRHSRQKCSMRNDNVDLCGGGKESTSSVNISEISDLQVISVERSTTHHEALKTHTTCTWRNRLPATATQHLQSTMECSQSAAWTTNWTLLVASRAKAFPGRQTNSDLTLPRAAHLDDSVIGSHQCITSHSGNAPSSSNMRPPPSLSTTSIPAPTQPIIAMTNYTHAPTVTNSSTSEIILRRPW